MIAAAADPEAAPDAASDTAPGEAPGPVPAGAPGRRPARSGRLPWRTALAGALVVTLLRPASWAVALAGFLAGGGLVIVTWPIVVLPTPTGLQNALGTPVSSLVFGGPSAGFLAIAAAAAAAGLALLVGALLAGAWAERHTIVMALDAAAEEGLIGAAPDLRGAPGAGRVALVRLASLAPVAVVAVLSWQPIYDATYRELTVPSELVTPLPIRVVGAVPGLLAAIVLTWLASDAAAAVGVRRLVLERRSVLAAWLLGWAALVRRPHRVLAAELGGLAGLALLSAPSLVAAVIGWGRVRSMVVSGDQPAAALAAVLIWVAVWVGGLALAGVGASFRSAVATMEAVRPG